MCDSADTVLEEVKEPESKAKERIVKVLKLSEILGPTEDGIKLLEEIGWKEQRISTTRQETCVYCVCVGFVTCLCVCVGGFCNVYVCVCVGLGPFGS